MIPALCRHKLRPTTIQADHLFGFWIQLGRAPCGSRSHAAQASARFILLIASSTS